MNIIENLLSAIRSVIGHKMRSALTMLGIIIGIGSVIMITSVGDGVKNSVFDTINTINKKMIQVYAWSISSAEDMLTLSDAKALESIVSVEKVTAVTEWYGLSVTLRSGDEKSGSVLGADENYSAVEEVNIALGRFITKEDVENHSRVVVLKPDIAFEVFGYLNCIGEKMELETWYGKEDFTVIGVFKGAEDESAFSSMISTPINRGIAVVPVTSLNDLFGYDEYIDFMGVTVHEQYSIAEASESITRLLDIRHNQKDAYYAESMEASFDQIDSILSAVTGFVAFVAAISLFVGGVGVMNIMLVTVKERTREIGIRKSIGATNGVIMFQFVMEAVILTALGGAIGIVFGDLTARLIGGLLSGAIGSQVVPVISVTNISIAFGVSSLVGIIFGVYPARKAAQLDPIEALRYE